jgi:PPOX class probable F420-dependent enzyme
MMSGVTTPSPPMGHGTNQRSQIVMSQEEIDELLGGRHSMTICTLRPDGSVHAVAMWYGFLEGCIALESKKKAQKVVNLRRDPRITVLVEDGEFYDELRGVSIEGTAEIVDDPDRMWTAGVSVFERYNAPYTDEMKPFVETMLHNRVIIKVKLGLPPMRPPEA